MAASKNKNKLQTTIVLIFVALALVAGLLTAIFGRRSEKIASNPPGTAGNTAGNLYQGGTVVEIDDYIFFSNPFDGGSLYRMNSDESECVKLSSAIPANLLAAGNHVYFFQRGSAGATDLGSVRVSKAFNRMRLDGKKAYSLMRANVFFAQMVGDWIYMEAENDAKQIVFTKVRTDDSDQKDIGQFHIRAASVSDSTLYYSKESDHCIYAINTANDSEKLVLEGNFWDPIVEGDFIYYLDLDKDYRICRYSFTTGQAEILSEPHVESYNLGHGYIYYQTMGDNPHLICMQTNGGNPLEVASGVYNSIGITSRYVYFKDYFRESILFHSPIGSGFYESCLSAQAAAIEAQSK